MCFSHPYAVLVSEQPVFPWPLSTVSQSRHLFLFLFSWSRSSGVRYQSCLGAGCQLAESGGSASAPSSSLSVPQDAYPGGQKKLLPLCFSSTRQICMKRYSSGSLKRKMVLGTGFAQPVSAILIIPLQHSRFLRT